MTKKDKKELTLELNHIFESGANEVRVLNMVESFIDRRYKALPIHDVSISLPLEKLHQWCKEEGYKVSAEITVRADNIRPIIVECDSISSVEEFAEHIGNER